MEKRSATALREYFRATAALTRSSLSPFITHYSKHIRSCQPFSTPTPFTLSLCPTVKRACVLLIVNRPLSSLHLSFVPCFIRRRPPNGWRSKNPLMMLVTLPMMHPSKTHFLGSEAGTLCRCDAFAPSNYKTQRSKRLHKHRLDAHISTLPIKAKSPSQTDTSRLRRISQYKDVMGAA